MRLLISSTFRHTRWDETSGHVYVFDVDSERVISKSTLKEPEYRKYDPNPRGGFRGVRGLSVNENEIAISNATSIFFFNRQWDLYFELTNPICAGVHDIQRIGSSTWVTSTRNDLIIKFDDNNEIKEIIDIRKTIDEAGLLNTKLLSLTDLKGNSFSKIDFRNPKSFNEDISDLLHVNSLWVDLEGDRLFILCGLVKNEIVIKKAIRKLQNSNRTSQFFSLYYSRAKKKAGTLKNKEQKPFFKKGCSILLELDNQRKVRNHFIIENTTTPSHTIRSTKNSQLVCLNSTTGAVYRFDDNLHCVSKSKSIGQAFLRGLSQIDNETLAIGDNHELIFFGAKSEEIISRHRICDDTSESIFDVKILPDNWQLPPEKLIKTI